MTAWFRYVRHTDVIAAAYAANPLQPSETIAAMTGKRGAA